MSNHTNSDTYYKNLLINRHVGGKNPPLLQTQNQYITDQQTVLHRQNPDLPPGVRYFQRPNHYQNPASITGGNNTGLNMYDTYNLGGLGNNCQSCNCNEPIDPSGKNFAGTSISGIGAGESGNGLYTNKEHHQDVYLRRDQDRYQPYQGYLFEKGLMSDGHQRRRIKSIFIDINSAFRSVNPSTSVEEPKQLQPDPLQFTNGSNIMTIIDPNHDFEINDSITLTGAQSRLSILRTFRGPNLPTFDIPGGCNFMKIYYNHMVPLTYNGDTIEIQLEGIQGDRGTAELTSFLGSIPINVINTTHKLRLTLSDADITCSTQSIIDSTGDPEYFIPNENYFFVVLPFTMANQSSGNPYVLRDYNFRLLNLSVAGVPLNQINADYPINDRRTKGFHVIRSVSQNSYTVEVSNRAIINMANFQGGGKCIFVSRIRSINVGYPNPNQYSIDLSETIHDIIAVRLVSSEIPNTEKAIRDFPEERANNKIYWNDIDDGNFLYMIEIPPGNYSPAELSKAMADAFLATPRITAVDPATREALGITYTDRHFIQPSININTGVVTFKSYKEFILNNPIIEVIPDISDDPTVPVDPNATYQLTINHPKHGMTTPGQTILIQNAVNYKGILGSVINGEKIVTEIIDEDTYRIELPKFNLIDNRADTGGGVNVFIYIPDIFRMRFDQPDTLGRVLGFRNPGDPNSVTPFDTIVSNENKYEFETGQNAVGQTIPIRNNALQLSGENYIIMVAEPLRTLLAIGKIKNAFAKILLCDSPGRILFNTYVPITHYYEDPLSELYRLDISFFTPDGNIFDFNGVDHSFTLEIVTVSDIPEGTGINANTGKNYNQEVR